MCWAVHSNEETLLYKFALSWDPPLWYLVGICHRELGMEEKCPGAGALMQGNKCKDANNCKDHEPFSSVLLHWHEKRSARLTLRKCEVAEIAYSFISLPPHKVLQTPDKARKGRREEQSITVKILLLSSRAETTTPLSYFHIILHLQSFSSHSCFLDWCPVLNSICNLTQKKLLHLVFKFLV